jgi:hypothetical protein
MADTIEKRNPWWSVLVKTKCEDIFTPEDFTEEQLMMRDSVKEFVDKSCGHTQIVLKKGLCLHGRIHEKKLVSLDF